MLIEKPDMINLLNRTPGEAGFMDNQVSSTRLPS